MTTCVLVYFWALYSVPLIYVSVFMPMSYYFDYYSFVISLEVRECDASSFILLSQNCFGYLGVFWFSMNFRTVCSCSVAKSCLILCDPMDCSTPGFPVLHYLLGFAEIHVHWVSDAIQPSHPLSPPSPVLNLSQHQSLFQWVSSFHRWPKYWSFSFSISPSNEYSGLICLRFYWFDLLAVQGQESSSTPQLESINSSVLSLLYGPTLTSIHNYWKNHTYDYMDLCGQCDVSAF